MAKAKTKKKDSSIDQIQAVKEQIQKGIEILTETAIEAVFDLEGAKRQNYLAELKSKKAFLDGAAKSRSRRKPDPKDFYDKY